MVKFPAITPTKLVEFMPCRVVALTGVDYGLVEIHTKKQDDTPLFEVNDITRLTCFCAKKGIPITLENRAAAKAAAQVAKDMAAAGISTVENKALRVSEGLDTEPDPGVRTRTAGNSIHMGMSPTSEDDRHMASQFNWWVHGLSTDDRIAFFNSTKGKTTKQRINTWLSRTKGSV